MQARHRNDKASHHGCAVCAILMVTLLMLSGCKKETDQHKAGDSTSPALLSPTLPLSPTPTEVSEAEATATLPAGADSTALMSVHTIPAKPPQEELPGMETVSGMNMTVRMSPRMKNSTQWVGSFPTLFQAATTCMSQLEDGAAYIAGINDHQAPIVHVILVGHDGYWHDCPVDKTGQIAGDIKEIEPYDEVGPAFFPRTAGRPQTNNPQCTALEPVVTLPDGLIGWLGFTIPDCAP